MRSVQPWGPNRCTADLIAAAIMPAVGGSDGCSQDANSASHRASLPAGTGTSCVWAGMWHLLLAWLVAAGLGRGPGLRPPWAGPRGRESRETLELDRQPPRPGRPAGGGDGRRRSAPGRASKRGWSYTDDDLAGRARSLGETPSLGAAGV